MWVDTSAGVRLALHPPGYGTSSKGLAGVPSEWSPEQAGVSVVAEVRDALGQVEARLLGTLLDGVLSGVRSRLRARQRARLRNPSSGQMASGINVSVADLWQRMDVDGDGTVTLDELQKLSKSLGAKTNKKQLKKMFAHVDTDGSGEIDYTEFESWWGACKRGGEASRDTLGAYVTELQAAKAGEGRSRAMSLAELHAEEEAQLERKIVELRRDLALLSTPEGRANPKVPDDAPTMAEVARCWAAINGSPEPLEPITLELPAQDELATMPLRELAEVCQRHGVSVRACPSVSLSECELPSAHVDPRCWQTTRRTVPQAV
jgi:hypothetical protein